jgi:hypothetical protein
MSSVSSKLLPLLYITLGAIFAPTVAEELLEEFCEAAKAFRLS